MSTTWDSRFPDGKYKLACTNLRKHHPLLTVLLDKKSLTPNAYEKKLFERVNPFMKTVEYGGHVTEEYLQDIVHRINLSPIAQTELDEVHWFRSFSLLLDKKENFLNRNSVINTKNLLENKDIYSIGENYIYKYTPKCLINIKNGRRCIKQNISLLNESGCTVLDYSDTKFFLEMARNEANYYDNFDRVNKTIGSVWESYQPAKIVLTIDEITLKDFNDDVHNNRKLSHWFPFKRKTAAHTKSNIYFDDALGSLKKESYNYYEKYKDQFFCLLGCSNDQATLFLQSHYILWFNGHINDLTKYVGYLKNLKLVKGLSDLCKNLGVANNPFLTWYVEADALYGRGSVSFELKDEFIRLTKTNGKKGENIQIEKGLVYDMAIKIFDEAMPQIGIIEPSERWRVKGETVEDAWTYRSSNCVNGSHHLPSNCSLPDVPRFLKSTRIAWLEQLEDNFLFKTSAKIVASLAMKFESPKMRPIKGEDSVAYFHEDYLLRTVEKYWEHSDILLDPSLATKYDEAKRIDDMEGDNYVMLDYTAMDMQHSLNTQYELRAALVDWLGMPEYMKEYYKEMELNQYIQFEGVESKLKFSLLTGRRSTTFINTVLCAIYLRIALKEHINKVLKSYYVGDDIILRVKGFYNAWFITNTAISSIFSFNERKQSYGPAGEFLRHSIRGKNSYGYVNRSLASFVCGSWVNEMALAETDKISAFNRACWTIANRSLSQGIGSALYTLALFSQTGLSYSSCRSVCSNRYSINGGPVHCHSPAVVVVSPITELIVDEMPKNLKSYATDDYIKTVAKPIISIVGLDVLSNLKRVFKKASYQKSLLKGYKMKNITYSTRDMDVGKKLIDMKILKGLNKGVISNHPTLPSLSNTLTLNELSALLYCYTGQTVSTGLSLRDTLFGTKPTVVAADIGMNYDDLSQLSRLSYFRHRQLGAYVKTDRYVHF